jgi:hypothetical protein
MFLFTKFIEIALASEGRPHGEERGLALGRGPISPRPPNIT